MEGRERERKTERKTEWSELQILQYVFNEIGSLFESTGLDTFKQKRSHCKLNSDSSFYKVP